MQRKNKYYSNNKKRVKEKLNESTKKIIYLKYKKKNDNLYKKSTCKYYCLLEYV